MSKKSRLIEAEVTEISLVKDGAVEDAEYEVLYKMADEETLDLPDPAEELAKAVQLVVDSVEDLEVAQAESLLKSLSTLSKEDTMEEEGTEDKTEGDSEEESEEPMDKEKMCKEDRLDALEKRFAELLAKLNTEVPAEPEAPAEELAKEESPLEEAERLLKERELAKAKAEADATEARILAALAQGVGNLESVSSGLAEAKRQFARATGQDA